jgi:hypothetical protein
MSLALKECDKCLVGEEDVEDGFRLAKMTKKMMCEVGEIIMFSDMI